MIRGAVSQRLEPRISLTFLDAADTPLHLDVEIDTAFAGFIALPPDVIAHLGLPPAGVFAITLADGRPVNTSCYFARVEWQGSIRTVRAYEMGTNPLLGINFLWGHRLTIDVKVGGDVTVEPLT
jgi:predicted aspartyl protease